MVSNDKGGVSLTPAAGVKNVFVNDWKPNFPNSSVKRVASIPFMRNLVEFTKGEDDPAFARLTSLLHVRTESRTITEGELFDIYNDLFGTRATPPDDGSRLVLDIIRAESAICLQAPSAANFENKIVLSIAIRLEAERMISAIADEAFVNAITGSQTATLLKEYKRRFPLEKHAIAILDKVALMTPENIHLNSFMYEPILDMSDEHLRTLYADLQDLAV